MPAPRISSISACESTWTKILLTTKSDNNFFYLGQGVREGSQPGDGGGGDEILEEYSAFVLIPIEEVYFDKNDTNVRFLLVSNTSLVLAVSSLPRAEGDGAHSHQSSQEEHKLLHDY